ncbi:MAG TPA: methylmalonyl Co-A mutase-associated GTPase MeaB [Chitinophagaceae bacterium]|nr:methylmalonyl Co-A mutase-associated GTPase MeaB [Chitinophagaceae bacterium]
MNWEHLYAKAQQHDVRSIARCISMIENEGKGYQDLLKSLPANSKCAVIGITGPPGAGKSTLTDGLIAQFVSKGKKVAVLCVDPSSPFNLGALLGDRIRMSEWYTDPNVYIRSLATRGSLGGLHPRIIEITEFLKSLSFDLVIVETVGVGQSEVEIAGLADITVVVLVPEAGDEIQTMKAGLMEIADIFVVNKSDRPQAEQFVKYLEVLAHSSGKDIPVIKTVASEKKGLAELAISIEQRLEHLTHSERKYWLLAERAYHLIRTDRMKDISKDTLRENIRQAMNQNSFNLYSYIQSYFQHHE